MEPPGTANGRFLRPLFGAGTAGGAGYHGGTVRPRLELFRERRDDVDDL